MKRYAAFLRGINISGKNKVSMKDLKEKLEAAGFSEVSTYLNSGNVAFSSDFPESEHAKKVLEQLIVDQFGISIPVHVIQMDELTSILSNAPEWWGSGDKEKYDNLIFILSSDRPEEICALAGAPSEGIERVQIVGDVIFWTYNRNDYRKSNWWKKTASAGISEKLTIRTANTVRKVCK